MIYRPFGTTDIDISLIGLGGHEFGEGGKLNGFQDYPGQATKPGFICDGFGQQNRREIVARALDLGINLFDVTIDSEKEAMGRLLQDLDPAGELLIQTRPEGMVYSYDPCNRKMADYNLLKAEVERICALLRRDHLDILNVAFNQEAIDADPEFLEKISSNIQQLKQAGLIRFASADTFSGEATYLQQFATGAFDSTFINYNPADQAAEERVFPDAHDRGIAIVTRECFRKGLWFALAAEAGIDAGLAARCAIKWNLRDDRISSVVLGVANSDQLSENCQILEQPEFTDEEQAALQAILALPRFQAHAAERRAGFQS